MSPVGGPRHYQGAGLGAVGLWGCPSCGEDNTGKIEEGCVHCGAGRPKAAPPPPPAPPAARVSEREPDDPTYHQPPVAQGDVADYWASQHPGVSIAEAYRTGYLEGIRAVRATAAAAVQPPTTHTVPIETPKTYRTMTAALAFFRDNVLVNMPEEVAANEWLSAEEATDVIAQLQEQLHG